MAIRVRIRGARVRAPSGYIVGRKSRGSGELEFLSPRDIAASPALKGVITPQAPTVLSASVTGLMTDQELIGSVTTSKQDSFAGATVSGWAQVPAQGNVAFSIRLNGITGTLLATVNFAAGANTPTLNWTGPTIIAAGTPIFVYGPSPADASLANVNWTIVG